MVLGGTSQIHATPLYSFSNEREQILAGCQVSVTYNFIVGGAKLTPWLWAGGTKEVRTRGKPKVILVDTGGALP
ncbi:hypothetical protein SAMN05216515_1372 [Eubacterium pyruvativorans]|nr:hypothetical protein SAMN05216515_1372 [Eubacterium pyruvativorans]